MNNRSLPIAIAALVLMSMTMGCFYVVEPGQRGVRVTLGKMTDQFIPPGFGLKLPLVTDVWRVNVQQDTREVNAECFSSDLQRAPDNRKRRIQCGVHLDPRRVSLVLARGNPST